MPLHRVAAVCSLALLASCVDGVSPGGSGFEVAFSLNAPAAVSPAEADALSSAFDRIDAYAVTVADSATGHVVLEATLPVIGAGPDAHRLDLTFPDAAEGLAVRVTVVGREDALELYRASGWARIQKTLAPSPLILSLRYTGPGIRGSVVDASAAAVAAATVQIRQGQTIVGTTATEPDGTFLFLPTAEGGPLGTGGYQVTVVPAGQQIACPGARSVTMTTVSAHIANFTISDTGCPIDLLIVSGGDVDDTNAVASMFAGSPNVIARTFFFVNRLPGVDYLSQFDVVLVFANGLFFESVQLGSEIAAYVQAGGNVIIGSFYWQNRSDSNRGSPGWGALETIDPFTTVIDTQTGLGGEKYQAGALGSVTTGDATTSDALVQGLSSLSSSGFRGGAAAKAGTTVVATWDDGTPLVGYRVLGGGQRIVGVTLFPASGRSAAGDVGTLWNNVVQWTGAAGGPMGATPPSPPVFDSRQPTAGTLPVDARTSQVIATGSSIQTFDDFTLANTTAIEHVEWQGIYCVQSAGAPAPAPTSTSFTVTFYPDLGNAPDIANALSSATYPMSRVGETFVVTHPNLACGTAPTSWAFYRYALTLNAPFVATAGTKYWLSVQAHTLDLSVYWGWRNGPGSDNRSIQTSPAAGTTIFSTDRAFSLRAR